MSIITEQLTVARRAWPEIAVLEGEKKNELLLALEAALRSESSAIFSANAVDVERAKGEGAASAAIDRLTLHEKTLEAICDGVRQVVELPDPIGKRLLSWEQPSGISIERVSVPIGVLAIVYEGRPNVTIDSIALALKSGSCAVLRGSRIAFETNKVLSAIARNVLQAGGITADAIQFIASTERSDIGHLLSDRTLVDAVIPRGGKDLINYICNNAKVPVIETGAGVCHVYLHADADPTMAEKIVVNAKVQRPSVCNAAETLLVHRDFAREHLPQVANALITNGVELRGCEETQRIVSGVVPAKESDYGFEFLSLIMAVKIVSGVDEAIDHITRYGTRHSESIVTPNRKVAADFQKRVDAAAVYHNCSTRFTDGFEFGFGAEIGISTQKLHARGPMGLEQLTTYKYVIKGDGCIRS